MEVLLTIGRPLRALALTAIAATLLGGCAGAPAPAPAFAPGAASPQPVAERQRVPNLKPTEPPGDLGSVERFAWQQVVQLGDDFAAGSADAFLSRVSRGFYRGYSTLEASIKALLDGSSDRSAVVAVRMVAEEEGRVSVRAEWTRSVRLRDGRVDARHGETVFLFLKSDSTLRLLDYRGDPPFAIDGI